MNILKKKKKKRLLLLLFLKKIKIFNKKPILEAKL